MPRDKCGSAAADENRIIIVIGGDHVGLLLPYVDILLPGIEPVGMVKEPEGIDVIVQ
jgi:hypothetical protein